MKAIYTICPPPALLILILFFSGMEIRAQSPSELQEISLEEFREEVLKEKQKPWVVDFWASWCKPCIYSIPELAQLKNKWAPRGVTFVSVSWDRDKSIARETARRLNMHWKHVFPPDIRNTPFLDKHFKHKFLPTIFLVYPNGKVKKVALESIERKLKKIFEKMD